MIHKSKWNTAVSGVVALFAAFVMATPSAQAQFNPFVITGAGIAPMGLPLPGQPARPHWAVGAATDLGPYYGQGTVETDTATFNSDGTITGEFGSGEPFMFQDKEGDILACEYGRVDFGASKPGTFTLIPLPKLGAGIYMAVFLAEFVPVAADCTGKFAGVSGSWEMLAISGPFQLGASDPIAYEWQGVGSLTLKKRK